MKKIGIVFFVYLNAKKNWRRIVRNQILDVKRSGIFQNSKFYIVVSNPFDISLELIHSFFKRYLNDPELSIFNENKFEYYGIHKLWEVANSGKHDYLVYFHTKGMSYKDSFLFSLLGVRSIRNKILTYCLFKKYKDTINFFDKQPSLNKIGFLLGQENGKCFTWYNFFWIRAVFVANYLEEPIETENRFYYETWNSLTKENVMESSNSAFSLYYRNNRLCSMAEATDILSNLRKLYKYTFPISELFMKLNYK